MSEDSEINKHDELWAECIRDAKGDMRKAKELYDTRRVDTMMWVDGPVRRLVNTTVSQSDRTILIRPGGEILGCTKVAPDVLIRAMTMEEYEHERDKKH